MPRAARKSKTDPILARILRVADHAYHEGEGMIADDSVKHGERGDTLADFIRVEIIEIYKNIEPGPEGITERQAAGDACAAIERAIDELEAVAAALEAAEREATT